MSKFYDHKGLKFILGPCLLESYDHARKMVDAISSIMDSHNVEWIYKTSFDKANRTSWKSTRGLGFDEAFYIFNDIKQKYPNLEVLTDIHEPWQCDVVNVDIIQIPAFLCRQTDLLDAAAKSGKPVNVKKGQFLSPNEMIHVIEKLEHFGAKEIMLTERGTTFGYNNLVVDMRSLQIMHEYGYPIIIDCTHGVQAPGGLDSKSGGDRRFAPTLAYAAYATGFCDAIFMEVHDNPDEAPSDGPNMIDISDLNGIVKKLKRIDESNNPVWKADPWAQLQVDYDRFDG